MDVQQFANMNLQPGARVFVEVLSHVVRAGVFLGAGESPVGSAQQGLFLSIEPEQRVVEWIELACVRGISTAIPAGDLDLNSVPRKNP